MNIVKEVYLLTNSYPKEELFALTSQTKSAAVSVASSIAEGIGRNSRKETIQFLHIARGSLYELETHLSIALMVNLIDEKTYRPFDMLFAEELRILNVLIRSYENKVD